MGACAYPTLVQQTGELKSLNSLPFQTDILFIL